MQFLPEALRPLAAYRQFLLYKLVWDQAKQKNRKIPINPHTFMSYQKGSNWQQDPNSTVDFETAQTLALAGGDAYGVGFLFTDKDPFFFVDLDDCLLPDRSGWTPVAVDIMTRLNGAAIEISQSGEGLHIFGVGNWPEHSSTNEALGSGFYTEKRFVALTGNGAMGSAAFDCSATLPAFVEAYFPPKVTGVSQGWTTEPVAAWNGPEDDDELIEKALSSQSAASVFGNKVGFVELWNADEDALSRAYPDQGGQRAYDASTADSALAQHLAFWTGNNCERILRLMQRSGLARDKWDREDYLVRTIERATSLQTSFYSAGGSIDPQGAALAEQFGAPKLRASSDGQRQYAESVRAQKLAQATEDEAKRLCSSSGANASAKFWLDNQAATPSELVKMVTPIEHAAPVMSTITAAEIVSGHQYLGATLQIEHFAGCVYVQDLHKIFTPKGALLKSEQFNATYGGYVFQLDETGDKTTRKAWDAFTESQIVRYPKAMSACFRPEMPPGTILEEEDQSKVNIYVNVNTPRINGDASPFLNHLKKLIPHPRDQEILLSYMAACVQHKGIKFQWAPLIQGAEGNGKTLFTRCVAFAVGKRYTHLPPAKDISEKFNEWLFFKLFIGIEDIFVEDNKTEVIEVLKPMISNDDLSMRAMQAGQVMGDNRANFMLNSNHKNGYRKTKNDRRIAPFFTAQQSKEDIERDGMGGDYFPKLYNWLKGKGEYQELGAGYGYAIVADFLASYQIADELNPATHCHRAPETTSTGAAIAASLGGVEQEILEAISEGRSGFAGGWVSSMAVDRLLAGLRKASSIPPNKRRELMQSLGYDWHPSLDNGRVNNFINIDGGKPRLFIKDGHIARNIASPSDVAKAYQEAQNASVAATPGVEVFGQVK